MPSKVITQASRGFLARSVTSASNASEPPSPRLSARMMTSTYFSETSSMIDQKTMDRMPRMFSGVTGIGWCPLKISFNA